jgi:hypothetical protein
MNPSFSVVVAFTFTALRAVAEVGGDVLDHLRDVRRHARRLGDDRGVDVHHAQPASRSSSRTWRSSSRLSMPL